MLKSATDGGYYIGYTGNIVNRIKKHNSANKG
ncbi:GIY-YIG nuclease family protein [Belliella filtrata]